MNRLQRTQQLERFAFQQGMEFSEQDQWSLSTFLEDFNLFRKGRRRKIRNILYQSDVWMETKMHIFDYEYRKGRGNRNKRSLHQQTVFFIHSKKLALPEFYMKPENLFHYVGSFLGIEDIDFEEHPKFSRRYYLKGEDEERIRDVFTPSVIRFFTIEKDWHIEGVGYYLILYKKNWLFQEKSLKDMIQKGIQLCELLKDKALL